MYPTTGSSSREVLITGGAKNGFLVRELTNETEILACLRTDRLYAAYAIGDLEPWFFRQCRWWLAETDGRWALILLFSGLQPPALFCLGEPDGVAATLDQAPLPECVYFTARPEHWPQIEARYRLQFAHPMLRMVLDAESFRPACLCVYARRQAAHGAVFRLRTSDLDGLQTLYGHGKPGDADGFAPFQVEQGIFYGLAVDGELVSVAGTHLVAPSYGLAALGNVFTHPAHRGRGYATTCTSAVTAALLAQGLDVVLNVAQANEPAVRLYKKLGYRVHCRFLEGVGEVEETSTQGNKYTRKQVHKETSTQGNK